MKVEANEMTNRKTEEHSFSIELKSKRGVKRMSFSNKENSHIFFEGNLGELANVSLVEGVMLEIEGVNGVLRLDITQQELERCFGRQETTMQGGGRQ